MISISKFESLLFNKPGRHFYMSPICSYQPGATEVIYGGQTSSRPKEPFIWSCMEHMEHGEVNVSLYSDVDHATKNNNAEYVMSTTVIEHRKNNHQIQRVQELSLVKVHRPLPQGGYGRPSWSVWVFGFGMLHSRWGILQTLLFKFNMVHLEKRWFPKFGIFEIPLKLPCSGEITIP